jgi:hypothetical protein
VRILRATASETSRRQSTPAAVAVPASTRPAPSIQRKGGAGACGGGCPRCAGADTARLEQDANRIADAVDNGGAAPHIAPAGSQPSQVTGDQPGAPLDAPTRRFMEARLGHDFTDVRVHTDAEAVASARGVDAKAYTVGSDLVFDAGRYAPHTPAGRRLIAHELAHVVQQRGGPAMMQRQGTDEEEDEPKTQEEQKASAGDVLAGGLETVAKQAMNKPEVKKTFVDPLKKEAEGTFNMLSPAETGVAIGWWAGTLGLA